MVRKSAELSLSAFFHHHPFSHSTTAPHYRSAVSLYLPAIYCCPAEPPIYPSSSICDRKLWPEEDATYANIPSSIL